jgi:2-oxoglutarate ferredoxin oxidoreductase subunit gamma
VQTIGKILAEAAILDNKKATYIPNFGVEQRGGVSIAYIKISENPIVYPKFEKTDIAAILIPRAIPRIQKHLEKKTILIYDNSLISQSDIQNLISNIQNLESIIPIPATYFVQTKLHPRVFNVLILGALIGATGIISLETAKKALKEKLGYKFKEKPELEKLNYDALELGFEIATLPTVIQKPAETEILYHPEPITKKSEKIISTRFPSLCKGCGLCIEKCPVKALSRSNILGVYLQQIPEIDLDKCIGCQICQNICPDCAIKIEKI